MRYALLLLALVLVACPEVDEPPLGMILVEDGVTYAGVASVDITPVIAETFTDLNGNNDFNGCLDDPTGTVEGCDEPFDDADGDGWFDATFIGGFGPMRPANDVHDPIYARALVLAQDGAYIALVGLDLVGIASPRTHAARDRLVEDGFAPERLIVAATHNHQVVLLVLRDGITRAEQLPSERQHRLQIIGRNKVFVSREEDRVAAPVETGQIV